MTKQLLYGPQVGPIGDKMACKRMTQHMWRQLGRIDTRTHGEVLHHLRDPTAREVAFVAARGKQEALRTIDTWQEAGTYGQIEVDGCACWLAAHAVAQRGPQAGPVNKKLTRQDPGPLRIVPWPNIAPLVPNSVPSGPPKMGPGSDFIRDTTFSKQRPLHL